MSFTHSLSTNRYGEADLIVSTSAANGTHVTLTSALAAAVSGQTVFLRDTVTENVTIPPGVNIAAWTGSLLNTPTIIGTVTMTGAGTSTISGVRLQTNSAALIAVTGSAASVLRLFSCYLNMTNNTGITFSSSSSSAQIRMDSCRGDLGTTGIAIFSHSSAGSLGFLNSAISNNGVSSTANTCSSGSVILLNSYLPNPITMSGTGTITVKYSEIDTSATNTTSLTTVSGTMNDLQYVRLSSGTATPLSVGGTVTVSGATLHHTNATGITGAGTLVYAGGGIWQTSTVGTISVTTLTPKFVLGALNSTAPPVGYIGEEISATVTNGAPVSLTTATPTTITSISLTPGIWDISSVGGFSGFTTGTQATSAIGTTTDSLAGTLPGNSRADLPAPSATNSDTVISIPAFRVSLSATTTYYLIARLTYTVGSGTGYGTIRAKRVA